MPLQHAVIAHHASDAQAVIVKHALPARRLRRAVRLQLPPLRQRRLVAKKDSDSTLPGALRLLKRSMEMKPSMLSSKGRRDEARSRYCWRPSALGHTSKITAIMLFLRA
jgi:hypothetical protein